MTGGGLTRIFLVQIQGSLRCPPGPFGGSFLLLPEGPKSGEPEPSGQIHLRFKGNIAWVTGMDACGPCAYIVFVLRSQRSIREILLVGIFSRHELDLSVW